MLRKISFHGFKSFADPVEMTFDNGINTIIGPNGSGKSNIFDGIRWILGETNAKSLRGGSMTDVIFGGCDTRKAMAFASVTLELDNSQQIFKHLDTPIVTVSKKISTDGKSEYTINGSPALHRDIVSLFMDTGMGSNSYSMIGQEQTKKLISEKTDERRAIFEEAAGIVRMKKQKKTTEIQLIEVDSNLTRMGDILKELEKQLTPLKRQAEKADKYNIMKKELEEKEVQLLLKEWDDAKITVDKYSTVFESLKEALTKQEGEISISHETLVALKSQTSLLNKNIFSKQSTITDLKENTQRLNGDISLATERLANANSKVQSILTQLKEIEEKYSLSTDDLQSKSKRLIELQAQSVNHEAERKKLNEALINLETKKSETKFKIEKQREKTSQLYNAITQYEYEYKQQQATVDRLQKELIGSREKKAHLEQIIMNSTEAYDKKKAELNEMSTSTSRLNKKLEHLRTEKNKYSSSVERLVHSTNTIDQTTFRLKAKLEHLTEMVDSRAGYYDGVKRTFEAQKRGDITANIEGTIGELLTVESGYETAFDIALQAVSQHIVVQNTKDAEACINYLKKHKAGRATFQPLSKHSHSTHPAPPSLPSSIVPALTCITTEDKYQSLYNHLLGRTLIANTLKDALAYSSKIPSPYRIVTKEGEVVNQTSITGGTRQRDKQGIFEMKKSIKELHASIQTNEEQYRAEKEQLVSLRNKSNRLIDEEYELNEILTDAKEKTDSINQELLLMKQNLEHVKEQAKDFSLAYKETELNITESKKASSALSRTINEKRNEYETLTGNLHESVRCEETTESEYSDIQQSRTNILLLIQKNEEEIKVLTDFLETVDEGNSTLQDKIQNLHYIKEREATIIADQESIMISLEAELKQTTSHLSVEEKKLQELKKQNDEAQSSLDEMEKKIKVFTETKSDTENQAFSIEKKIIKAQSILDQSFNRLNDEYNLTESQFGDIERSLLLDQDDTKATITRLKKNIEQLGSINHTAASEYEVLEKRFAEETKQYNDVRAAKEDISVMLKGLEEEMTERFIKTFNTIATHFKRTFVDLFKGGKANVFLENPKSPLESHIRIQAQPPGKKPQTLELLSGGERNLVAVSLIFAILSSVPTPFVYLDEVDAPLDEANVGRYAQYLKMYSEKSQFIVVTHRQGTKYVADKLYGVTIEEPGVSKVFPYQLKKTPTGSDG